MRVSVIITCRNYEDLVADAIRSVFDQDYEPKRVFVVNDASDDDSWDVIQDVLKDSPCPCEAARTDQPMGQSWCKNFAMQAVWDQSDAFAFLDADDVYLPGKIARSVDLLSSKYGKIGLVYSDEHVTDISSGRQWIRFHEPFSLERIIAHDCVGGNFIISKSVIASEKGFDESLRVGENYDLAVRAVQSHVLLHIPEPLVHVRVTSRSLWRSVSAADWEYSRRIVAAKVGQRNHA